MVIMENILTISYFLVFGFFSYKNFRWATALLILFLPAYLVRFSFGSLPSTLLEISFGAWFLAWLVKYFKKDWPELKKFFAKYKWLSIFGGLFLVSSAVGVFTAGIGVSAYWSAIFKAAGQWRAYFLEPILAFVILVARRHELDKNFLIWSLMASSLPVSVVAVVQKLTGSWYPPSLWDDVLGGRVVSFFTSPNAVGLFLVPIILLSSTLFLDKNTELKKKIFLSMAMVLAVLAVIFSWSQGAWIGLGAGVVASLYFLNKRKVAIVLILLGLVAGLIFAPLRSAILFQDRASQNRLKLWSYSWTFFTKSPQNFILGSGIRQFYRQVQKPFYNQKEMERLIYPHNFFINFWNEIGLTGMLSMTGIVAVMFYLGWQKRKTGLVYSAGILACLVGLLVHGLVDVPYFKNDLAFLFWIVASLFF